MFRKERKDPTEKDSLFQAKHSRLIFTEVRNGLPLPGQPRRSWLPWKKERNY